MKNKKIILLIFLSLLITGCSAEYNITIDNNTISEDITIYNKNLNDANNEKHGGQTMNQIYKTYAKANLIAYNPLNKNTDSVDYPFSPKIDGVYYYETRYLNSNIVGLNAKYNYEINSYKKAGTPPTYVRYFGVDYEKNILEINANDFSLLKNYKNLDTLNVTITTNYKVKSNNADSVSGNKYTWNISNGNYSLKRINMIIDLNKTKEDNDENNLNYPIIILISLLVIFIPTFIVFLIYLNKNYRNKDKI